MTDELPELLVGAGTVLTVEQAKKAVAAGAQFIVSPGFNTKVIDYCLENNIPVTTGVNSPTQIEMALEKGIKIVKKGNDSIFVGPGFEFMKKKYPKVVTN